MMPGGDLRGRLVENVVDRQKRSTRICGDVVGMHATDPTAAKKREFHHVTLLVLLALASPPDSLQSELTPPGQCDWKRRCGKQCCGSPALSIRFARS